MAWLATAVALTAIAGQRLHMKMCLKRLVSGSPGWRDLMYSRVSTELKWSSKMSSKAVGEFSQKFIWDLLVHHGYLEPGIAEIEEGGKERPVTSTIGIACRSR